MTPHHHHRRASQACDRREDALAEAMFKEGFNRMFPAVKTKPALAKSPPPTMNEAISLLIGMFERKLAARHREEADKKAAAERALMAKLAALEAGAAAARKEFETLDEQLRQVVASLERAGLAMRSSPTSKRTCRHTSSKIFTA